MKKILLIIIITFSLFGCANMSMKRALDRTNLVKNGMTQKEVEEIMGIPAAWESGNRIYWGYGNYYFWNGTRQGAAMFEMKDGKTVNIPEGGMFSPAGAKLYQEFKAKLAEEDRIKAAKEKAQQELDDREAARRKKEASELQAARTYEEEQALLSSLKNSTAKCNDKLSCAKMFALSQIYVSNNSDMKIQVATDTIIETYNPTDTFSVGLKVAKMPLQGTVEEIILTVSCKDTATASSSCRTKKTTIYKGFKPFLEQNIRN